MYNPHIDDICFIPPPPPPGALQPGSIEEAMHRRAVDNAASSHKLLNHNNPLGQGGIHNSAHPIPPFQGGVHNVPLPGMPNAPLPGTNITPPFQGGIHNSAHPEPPSQGGLSNSAHPEPPFQTGNVPPPKGYSKRQSSADTVKTLSQFRFPQDDGSNSFAVPQEAAAGAGQASAGKKRIELLPPLFQTQSSTSTTVKRPSKTPSPSAQSRRSRRSNWSSKKSSKKSGGNKRQKVKRLGKDGYVLLRARIVRLRRMLNRLKSRGKRTVKNLAKSRK